MSVHARSGAALIIAMASTFSAFDASAKDVAGRYVSLYAGPSSLSSTTLTESRTSGGTASGDTSFDTGVGFGGAFGYRYGNGWAAEVAWDFRRHGVKKIGTSSVDGDFASNTFFVNGYYRFAKWGDIRPFVGAGLGWTQEIDIDIKRNGRELSYSRSGAAAVQVMFGGEWDLSPKWSLVGDVRLMRVSTGTFDAEDAAAGGRISGDIKYRPVSINLGVTYRF
ncbi:MAG: porin family protein [Rhodocyclaceae bacterium]|jgi:outer membrane protein W|nr:porin family protein [Rhodocyclaceae bacterium]MCE2980692.1 porin family protein [Betaproteobacteria bacterium]MCA3075706.1 porin family protein [Rhodocyclaceae bacterium]MCA3089939.1 porin family protein [Rhodocyclaceae bacterium]MCA3093587.1 porin family protein [Rhodocyclaceae bacterium]